MRIRIGSLQLERSLPRGRWRELTPEEISALLNPAPLADAPSAAAGNPGSGP
jgi:16S rRNA U516 pseudouridylate synthase RsuA-like enzyme